MTDPIDVETSDLPEVDEEEQGALAAAEAANYTQAQDGFRPIEEVAE